MNINLFICSRMEVNRYAPYYYCKETPPRPLNQGGGAYFLILQFSDSYKALNPQCEVPTLKIDGLTLTQSVMPYDKTEPSQEYSFRQFSFVAVHHRVSGRDQRSSLSPTKGRSNEETAGIRMGVDSVIP